jgi:uncharacterized protein involved in exopolysaccharide biosynthesis
MHEPEKQEEEYKIPLSDLIKTAKQKKGTIAFYALSCAVIMGGYSLAKPVIYQSEATFKEKSNSRPSMNSSSLASILLSGMNSSSQSEAKTMMSSRKLMKEVAKNLNLQAILSDATDKEGMWKRIKENLVIEYTYFRDFKKRPLPDKAPTLITTNIVYPGEIPLSLKVNFDSDSTFQILDSENRKISTGRIGTPFSTHEYAFTFKRVHDGALSGKTYNLTLLPLNDVAKGLSEQVKISSDKEDPLLLKLAYQNRDRQLASAILNELMSSYQNYLKEEQLRISNEQISYLNRREEEMGNNLKSMIESYASKLSNDVSSVGYADSEKAMDFFTDQLQQYREKTLMVDLMLKRLTGVLDKDSKLQMDAYFQEDSNPSFLNRIVEEMCRLKQEGDCIELAIRSASSEGLEKWQAALPEQVAAIEDIRKCHGDACTLLAQLEKGEFPKNKIHLLDNEKYKVGIWFSQLKEIEEEWKNAATLTEKEKKKEEWFLFKEQFAAYLSNLVNFLEVNEKSIHERLSHQQAPQTDFQGINPDTVKELYITYINQQSELEGQILQYTFLIDELKDPNFEISSLSSLITDSVTRELVDNASELVLGLQDDANRSSKEKERMKNDLQIKRKFLGIHLNQTIDLLKLQIDLIKEKVLALQNANLGLIRQQTTILEKQLSDSIRTHIRNLQEERKLISENEEELKQEMSALPQKWASEKMIEQQLKLNAAMVEEVTKLVESKNITSNLEMIQSAPIDAAIPRIRPQRPNVILFTVIGGILGGLLSACAIIANSLIRGFPASKENLELYGMHVAGMLSKDKVQNVKSLKRLISFFNHSHQQSLSLLFVRGQKYDCLQQTAQLLQMKGDSVLLLKENLLNQPIVPYYEKLTKYLDGTTALPIDKGETCDILSLGCSLEDMLSKSGSLKMKILLSQLKEKYRWVIADASSPVNSIEIEELIQTFDSAVCIVNQEPVNTFTQLIQTLKNEGKVNLTSFLIVEDL